MTIESKKMMELSSIISQLKTVQNKIDEEALTTQFRDKLNEIFPTVFCNSVTINRKGGVTLYGAIAFPSNTYMERIAKVIVDTSSIERQQFDLGKLVYDIELDSMFLSNDLISLTGEEILSLILRHIGHMINYQDYYGDIGNRFHSAALSMGFRLPTPSQKLKMQYTILCVLLYMYNYSLNSELVEEINKHDGDPDEFLISLGMGEAYRNAFRRVNDSHFSNSLDFLPVKSMNTIDGQRLARIYVNMAMNFETRRAFVSDQIQTMINTCHSELLKERLNFIAFRFKTLLKAVIDKGRIKLINTMETDTLNESWFSKDIINQKEFNVLQVEIQMMKTYSDKMYLVKTINDILAKLEIYFKENKNKKLSEPEQEMFDKYVSFYNQLQNLLDICIKKKIEKERYGVFTRINEE